MIWITGSKGMLAKEVAFELSALKDFEFAGTDSEVDITDINASRAFVNQIKNGGGKIDFIVNCAAYTAVDKAEDEEEQAQKINAEGAGNLALLCEEEGARLIHISTDYVFDGSARFPIKEGAQKNPLNAYGRTKAQGDDNVIQNTGRHYILRASWLYGLYGRNFVYTMIRLMNANQTVRVVDDQKGSPTSCVTLANVICLIIKAASEAKKGTGKSVPCGVYNVTDKGGITWYDFAQAIYEEARARGKITSECSVIPCSSDEYKTKASRPKYSVLDISLIQETLKIKIKDWRESLTEFLDDERFSVI